VTKNQIIESLFTGKNFNDCITKMEPRHLQDDLKMEVISIVCEWPEEKVIGLYQRKELEFYVVRVILNQVKSNTSPFTRKYRQIKEQYDEAENGGQNLDLRQTSFITTSRSEYIKNTICKNVAATQEEVRDREIKELLEQIALEEIDRLYWYDAEMLRLYMKLGTFRAIQEHTGIPFISCYKNIQKSLSTLKKKAFEKAEPIFSKEELSFIQNNKPCRDI
jgi:hypothetical protein